MALPIRCLTGSTTCSLAPNMRRVSDTVVPRCRSGACIVVGGPGVLVLIDDLHPHEALAGVRQRDRRRPGIEVDDRKRIQRVAVGTNDALLDRRSKFAAMPEFSKTAVLDHPGEIHIGLGAVVVLDGDRL